MQLRQIDPNDIKVPEVRVTSQWDAETYEQFKQFYATAGQIAPVICCEVDGEIVLVDGLHRVQEALQNKCPFVEVAIMPGGMLDVLTRNLFLDNMRGKHPPSQMVKVIEALWKEYGQDSEKIAARTGLKRDYIEKLQSISELTPLARQFLDDGEIGISHAYELTRIKDPARQEVVLQQQRLYRWTVKDLREHISNILAMADPPPPSLPGLLPPPPPKIKCFFCHDEFDISEIANPNTCVYCSGTLIQAIGLARREEAKERESNKGP